MLLRDLQLKPREEQRYFDVAWVGLGDGTALYVQLSTKTVSWRHSGLWYIYRTSGVGFLGFFSNERHMHGMDEFEAQAVLDHYANKYGLKPSRDT